MVITSANNSHLIPQLWTEPPSQLTHESSRECWVGTDLTVDLDKSLHHDLGDFGPGQGILQAISQENQQRQGLAQLVWAG